VARRDPDDHKEKNWRFRYFCGGRSPLRRMHFEQTGDYNSAPGCAGAPTCRRRPAAAATAFDEQVDDH